ncbi:MAG: acyl carrier protein [Acidobacteriota bacterium]
MTTDSPPAAAEAPAAEPEPRSGKAICSRPQVLAGIAAVSREHLDFRQPLSEDLRLVEDLGLDSMRAFTLAAEVENHFKIMLSEEDEDQLVTVGDLVQVVIARLESVAGEVEESS